MNDKNQPQHIVFVVDDDELMRVALSYLFQSMNLPVKVFTSAAELLNSKLPDIVSCLVLDIRLPGVSGLEFQDVLAKAGIRIPIVFITGHGDIPMSVRAMKAGAVDFLTKPFRDQDMLDAVTRALELDRKRREGEVAASGLRARLELLTPAAEGGADPRHLGLDEQADRRADECQRNHRQNPSRTGDEEDGGALAG